MELTRRSPLTGKIHTIFIEGLTEKMIKNWKDGALAQDAFRGIPAELREFIMTGITPEEWEKALPPEPEDVEEDSTQWYV